MIGVHQKKLAGAGKIELNACKIHFYALSIGVRISRYYYQIIALQKI